MDAAICSFYGLRNPPFGPAARTAPFFRTDARNALIRGIADEVLGGRAVTGVRGDHGIGKSVLVADVAAALRARGCLVVVMGRADHGPKALQDAIGLTVAPAASGGQGRSAADRLVLLFDDAEAIPAAMFRMLWQLVQTCGTRVNRLHLVLIGGTGLWAGLNAPDLAGLRKAAISEILIPYLQEAEAADYLDRKLQFAGQPLAALMTKRAIADLVAHAHGLPARLDTLAERALSFGYEHGRRRITSRRMRQALSDSQVSEYPALPAPRWVLGGLACLAAAGAVVAWQAQGGGAPARDAAPVADMAWTQQVAAVGLAPSVPVVMALPVPLGLPAPIEIVPAVAAAPARIAASGARPGLVLLAGHGDTLRSMYGKIYRGTVAPDFDVVRAANTAPVRPGSMVVFPAPAAGWPAR